MRLLYSKPKINNHQFVIYYLYYKKKPEITKAIYNCFLMLYLTDVIEKISQQLFFLFIIAVFILLN